MYQGYEEFDVNTGSTALFSPSSLCPLGTLIIAQATLLLHIQIGMQFEYGYRLLYVSIAFMFMTVLCKETTK